MNLFGMMQITGSALKAERVRAEMVAANMANAETTRTESGTPYQRQTVLLEAAGSNSFANTMQGMGMTSSKLPTVTGFGMSSLSAPDGGVNVTEVAQSSAPALQRYDPTHPDADANGYVSYPDISPVTEMVDLMGASRSYSLNAGALQAEKGMLTASTGPFEITNKEIER